MPKIIKRYVNFAEWISRILGRATMYMIFAMIGVLLFSSFMKTFFLPPLWTFEMAQFMMVAYFLLGGGYSMQLDAHVRMDLLYGNWKPKRKAFTDSITSFCLIFYLCLLLYGGYSSTEYAVKYGETSYSSWSPYMAPIKIIMTFGIFIMLLQAVATFFRDFAAFKGLSIEDEPHKKETVL